jgi:hypothetical protein
MVESGPLIVVAEGAIDSSMGTTVSDPVCDVKEPRASNVDDPSFKRVCVLLSDCRIRLAGIETPSDSSASSVLCLFKQVPTGALITTSSDVFSRDS